MIKLLSWTPKDRIPRRFISTTDVLSQSRFVAQQGVRLKIWQDDACRVKLILAEHPRVVGRSWNISLLNNVEITSAPATRTSPKTQGTENNREGNNTRRPCKMIFKTCARVPQSSGVKKWISARYVVAPRRYVRQTIFHAAAFRGVEKVKPSSVYVWRRDKQFIVGSCWRCANS